jgi:hypothetical protein
MSIHCLFTAYSLPIHCLCMPIHCLFTVYSLPIHCLCTAFLFTAYYSLPSCTDLSRVPIHCLFTAYSLPTHFLYTASCTVVSPYSLPMHCLCSAYALPIHCLFTAYSHIGMAVLYWSLPVFLLAYSLPIHCLFTAYSLPIHCLFTAYSLPIHCLLHIGMAVLYWSLPVFLLDEILKFISRHVQGLHSSSPVRGVGRKIRGTKDSRTSLQRFHSTGRHRNGMKRSTSPALD